MKTIALILILALAVVAYWWRERGVRIYFERQQHIALIAIRPYFESWKIEWSDGWNPLPGGKTLWHTPTFQHFDMRGFLTNLTVTSNMIWTTTNFTISAP